MAKYRVTKFLNCYTASRRVFPLCWVDVWEPIWQLNKVEKRATWDSETAAWLACQKDADARRKAVELKEDVPAVCGYVDM